jgi:hypothetical protein
LGSAALIVSGSSMMAHDILSGNEQKRLNRKKWLGVLALVSIVSCLAVIAWIARQMMNYEPFTARNHYPTRPDSNKISSIEGNAEIVIPSSAHDIYVYTTGFQDILTKVRFSMDADELDEFMVRTLCEEPLGEIQPKKQSAADGTSKWWTPNQAEHLRGCTGNNDHAHQTVMVDMTNTSVYVVFVSTSTY